MSLPVVATTAAASTDASRSASSPPSISGAKLSSRATDRALVGFHSSEAREQWKTDIAFVNAHQKQDRVLCVTLKGVVQKHLMKLDSQRRLHRNVNKVGGVAGYHVVQWIITVMDVHPKALDQLESSPVKTQLQYLYMFTGWYAGTELPEISMDIFRCHNMFSDQVETIDRTGYMSELFQDDVAHDWNFNCGVYYFSEKDIDANGMISVIRHRFRDLTAKIPHSVMFPFKHIGSLWFLQDNGSDNSCRLRGPKGYDHFVHMFFDVEFEASH